MITLEQACEKAVKFATRGISSICKLHDGYLIFMKNNKEHTTSLEFNPIFIQESTGEIKEYYPLDNYSELKQREELEIPLEFKADSNESCEYLSKIMNKVKEKELNTMKNRYNDILYEDNIQKKVDELIDKKQQAQRNTKEQLE